MLSLVLDEATGLDCLEWSPVEVSEAAVFSSVVSTLTSVSVSLGFSLTGKQYYAYFSIDIIYSNYLGSGNAIAYE